MFSFEDYPITQERVRLLLSRLGSGLETAIVNGINAEWTLANNKNNELSRRVFGDNIGRLTQAQYRRYFSTNDNAREAFLRRKEQGLNLSERVWKYADDFKNDIELGLDVGIRNGLDAPKMARQLQQFLQHPDMLFRRVRNEHGNLVLSQRAADFHPGRGVYRSSYMNARRLAVTETNIAYRTADYERYKQLDFVVGIEVRLSNNHNCKGVPKGTYYDICDELQGKYPKDFKFTGWHPHCRCHVVSILKTEAELSQGSQAILNGEEPSEESVNRVDEVPEAFKKWVENNSDRIAKAKNQPYFLKDNGTYKNGAWTIKEFAQSKPITAPKIKTPSIQQTELPALNESQLELYKAAMAAEKDERDTIIIDLMNELQINGMTYPEAVEFVKANFRKSDKWLVGNTYFGDNMVIGKRGAFRSDVTPNGLFAEPYEPSKWIYERVKAKGGTLTIEDTQQLVRDAASRYEITYSEAERMIRGLGYGNKYYNIQFYTNSGLYNIYAEKRQIEKVFTPATPAKPTLLELAEKRHAARTPEEVQKIKDKWVKRKERNARQGLTQLSDACHDGWLNVNDKTLSDISNDIDLGNFDRANSRIKTLLKAAERHQNRTLDDIRRIQDLADERIYGKAYVENVHKIEDALGVKRGKRMTFDEADQGKCNPLFGSENYKELGYAHNCQTCTMTYELRRIGFNVEAMPNPKVKGYPEMREFSQFAASKGTTWVQRFINADGTPVDYSWSYRGSGIQNTIAAKMLFIEEQTQIVGRYEIYCAWEGGGAHVFIAEKTSTGELLLYDPQSGKKGSIADFLDSHIKLMKHTNIGVLRIDDKLINTKFAQRFLKATT